MFLLTIGLLMLLILAGVAYCSWVLLKSLAKPFSDEQKLSEARQKESEAFEKLFTGPGLDFDYDEAINGNY